MNDAVRGEDQEHLLEQEQLRFGFIAAMTLARTILNLLNAASSPSAGRIYRD